MGDSVSATAGLPGCRRTDEQTRPSIAVLPFDNLSGDVEQEYFSDGLTEDIITSLSRFSDLLVIARNSSFAYRDKAVDIRVIGQELGVQYVLRGSVRKAGSRVRVTAQLSETGAGTQVWAERFDHDLDNIFEIQDLITSQLVTAVSRGLAQREGDVSRTRSDPALRAWELTAQAEWYLHRTTAATFAKARTLCDEVTERYPDYARGHAILAYVCIMQSVMSSQGPPQAELWKTATVAADKAIALEPDNELGRVMRATVLFDKARSVVTEFSDRYPGSTLSLDSAAKAFKVREEFEYIASGLHLATEHDSGRG